MAARPAGGQSPKPPKKPAAPSGSQGLRPAGAGPRPGAAQQSPQGAGKAGAAARGAAGAAGSAVKSGARTAAKKSVEGAAAAYTGGASKLAFAILPTPLDSPEEKRKKKRRLTIAVAAVVFLVIAGLVMQLMAAMMFLSVLLGGGSAGPMSAGQCLSVEAEQAEGGPDAPRPSRGSGQMGYPVDPETPITSGFGPRWGTIHDGVDFGAPVDAPIYAVADGVVVAAGPASGYDHWIRIEHEIDGEKIESLYGHIDAEDVMVKVGDRVTAGQQIAAIGVPGPSTPDTSDTTTGAHLHFGIYPGGWSSGGGVDPMPYLDKMRAMSPQGGDGPVGEDVLVVGDSIANGAKTYLSELKPEIQIDAKDGRPFTGPDGGAAIIRDRIDNLPSGLVIEMGTNNGVTKDDYHGLINEIHEKSPDTKIVVVNTYGPELEWTDATNEVIESAPGTTLVDWHALATEKPELIQPDKIHPTPDGAREFAQLVVDGLDSGGGGSGGDRGGAPVEQDSPPPAEQASNRQDNAPPAQQPEGTVTAADWEKLAQCESGGKWDINTGNGFLGGLQFTQQTWEGFNGTEYAPSADQATKEQQMEVANRVLEEQGWGAWPHCTNSEYPELKGLKPAPPGTFVGGGSTAQDSGDDGGEAGGDAPSGASAPAGESAGSDLQGQLDQIVQDAQGAGVTLGVSATPVEGGGAVTAGASGDEAYSASAIKVAIAAAVESKLKQDDDVEVSEDDVVGGTGSGLSAGSYKVSELENKMITASDNTATNALIDAVGGFDAVNSIISDAGVSGGYSLSNKMMSGDNTSTMSADGAGQFLVALWKASESDGGFIPKESAGRIIDLMKQQTVRTKLPAQIPQGKVANKTGENTGVSHDIGFIWPANGDPYAVAVTSTFDGAADAANGFIADVGKTIYDSSASGAPGGGSSDELPPTPESVGSEEGLQTDAVRGMRLIAERYPEIKKVEGHRPDDPSPDVASGRAIDIPLTDDISGKSQGDRLAEFFADNAEELHVQYISYNGQIWDGGSWAEAPNPDDAPPTRVRITFQGGGAPNADTTYMGVGDGGSDTSAAAPNEPSGDQLSQNLSPEQLANIKQIIVQAKNAGFEPAERAAVLGVMMSGYSANYINMDADDDPNKVGIFAETPMGSRTPNQLMDVQRTAERFMEDLKKETDKRPNWATDKATDVLVAVYPNRASYEQELERWEQISTEIVQQLWDDENAQRGSRLERIPEGAEECAVGSTTGQALNEGEVPPEFVKWLKLGAQECDGVDAPLLAAQIKQEGDFQPHGHNSAGAAGYTQFIDGTWNTWGHKVDEEGKPIGPPGSGDRNNIGDAVMAQARYMCHIRETIDGWMKDGKVRGDLDDLTLAGYNAGEHRVLEFGGMPTGGEFTTQTQPYVKNIQSMRETYANGNISESEPRRERTSTRSSRSGDGSIGEKALDSARQEEGKPYVWGGIGPAAFDCSGLTQKAYRDAGIELPRTAAEQYLAGKETIPWDEAKPGDLIFSSFEGGAPGHVSIYVSPTRHYEAQTTGVPVGEHDVWASDMVVKRMY